MLNPIFAIRDVTSISNMPTVFDIFFISLYFPHSKSNIEAQIGFIVLQTCLCHDKVFDISVFRLCFGILNRLVSKRRMLDKKIIVKYNCLSV